MLRERKFLESIEERIGAWYMVQESHAYAIMVLYIVHVPCTRVRACMRVYMIMYMYMRTFSKCIHMEGEFLRAGEKYWLAR